MTVKSEHWRDGLKYKVSRRPNGQFRSWKIDDLGYLLHLQTIMCYLKWKRSLKENEQ